MKDLSEYDLCKIAQTDESDDKASEAMRELRKRFDSTYFWCEDCDGLVTTEKECCLEKLN